MVQFKLLLVLAFAFCASYSSVLPQENYLNDIQRYRGFNISQVNYWNPYYSSYDWFNKQWNYSKPYYNKEWIFPNRWNNTRTNVDTYKGIRNSTFNGRLYPPTSYCLPNFYNCSGSHNLFVGCIKTWDRLLYNRRVYKEGRWWSSREKIIKFPEYGPGHLYNTTISGIRIYDRYCNNQGGYASITSGGVGYKNVTIRLYSTGWGKGFDFLVQVFGS